MLSPGSPAPDFSGTDIVGGGTFTLSAHGGEVICLAMSAYWCPHCTNELTRLQNLWIKYQGHGVQMVAVHVDPDQAAAQAWLAGLGVTYPVVQDDAANTIFNSYATGTGGIPQLYIIDRNQVIHSASLGAETEPVIEGHILDAIYARDPVDLEMVMDVSDSMNSAPGGGDSKLVMMRQASKMVVDFMRDHGQTGDRMGLVWFTDDRSEYVATGGVKLIPVLSGWSDLKDQIDIHGTGICTAMGAGLQTAFDTLAASTQGRFGILLTDGMQNIEPKLAPVGGHYEIIDSGGWLCGGHSSVPAHPGVDIATYNTTVHTIGVGITATYASLLQDVANATGGFYLGTYDPASDLDLIYFVDLCNCLAGGSPTIVHHHAGVFQPRECQVVETFCLNRSIRKLTAILSWEKTLAGNLAFWLCAPDGSLLDLHKEMKLYDAYAMATVYLPKEQEGKRLPHAGEWRMIIRGETAGQSAPYHALVVAEDAGTRFRFERPRKSYEVGDVLPLHLRLEQANVALVRPQEVVLEQAALRVPPTELLARHRFALCRSQPQTTSARSKYQCDPLELKLKALARDPRLRQALLPVRKRLSLSEGTLDCEITDKELVLPVRLTAPGLHTFRLDASFDGTGNDPIQRVAMVSVQVEPGKPDSGRSTVKAAPLLRAEARGLLVHVVPRNATGHLFGPGWGAGFGVRRGEGKVEWEVEDALDGSYRVELMPKKKLPAKGEAIEITFCGRVLWAGSLA